MATEPHHANGNGDAVGTGARSIRVEFAQDRIGRFPAREFLAKLESNVRTRYQRIFDDLKRDGFITNDQRFQSLSGELSVFEGLFDVKGSNKWRLLGAFRPGGRFLLTHGFYKTSWKVPHREGERAQRILAAHDALENSRQVVSKFTPRPKGDEPFTDRDLAAATMLLVPAVPKPEMVVDGHAWVLSPTSQLLPKDAPLNISLASPPWRKWVVDLPELKLYLVDRMNALSPETRIAMNLLDPQLDPKFLVGALWGTEYLATRPHPKEALEEAAQAVLLPAETTKADFDDPVADPVPEELPIAAEGRPVDSEEFPWFCRVGKGQKKPIAAIVGRVAKPGKSRVTGSRDPKLVVVTLRGAYNGGKRKVVSWSAPKSWRPAKVQALRHPLTVHDVEAIRSALPLLKMPKPGKALFTYKRQMPEAASVPPAPVPPPEVPPKPPAASGEFPKFYRRAHGPRRFLVAVVGRVARRGKAEEKVFVRTYYDAKKRHGWCDPVRVPVSQFRAQATPLPPQHPDVLAAAPSLR